MHLPRRLRPLILLAAAVLLYLPLLGRRDIVTGHEARVAQTAREMERTWPWQNAEADRLRVDRVVLTDIGSGVLRLYPAADGSTVSVNPWLVPVLQGLIRLQKPPLPYWCAAIPLKIFSGGNMGQGWARLVPALMGVFGVLFMYDLARLTIGRAGAWAAGLVWVSSYLPFEEYRLAMPDPYLAFFTLVCVWAWVKCSKRSRASLRLLLAFYLSLAFGVLAKGPLIFLHVGIAVGAYHACYRRGPGGRLWHHLVGIAVFVAVALPWIAYIYREVPDAAAVWRYESVGELSNNLENVRPWWFYLPAAVQVSLPWAPVWLAGLVLPFVRGRKGNRDRRGRARGSGAALGPRSASAAGALTGGGNPPDQPYPRRDSAGEGTGGTRSAAPPRIFGHARRRAFFPLIWYGVTLIFFSLVHQKKAPYLLPVLPAQVLLTARALVALLGHARLTWARGSPVFRGAASVSLPRYSGGGLGRGQARQERVESGEERRPKAPSPALPRSTGGGSKTRRDDAGYLLGAQAVLGALCAVIVIVLAYRENRDAPLALVVLGCVLGLAAGVLPVWLLLRRPRSWLAAQSAAYGILLLLTFEGIITPKDNRRSARPACAVAAAMLQRPGTAILTNVLAEEAAVYLPLGIADRPGHRVLVLFDDQQNVELRKQAARFGTTVPGDVPWGDGPVDETYLRRWDTWTGGGHVIDARRIAVPGQAGDVRWKLFELTVDRKMLADASLTAHGRRR